jgi:uncharacterized DUF497 family protein
MDIEFTWDRAKARRNLKKHRVTFEQAQQVFFDPYLIVVEDCEVDGEMRSCPRLYRLRSSTGGARGPIQRG